MRFKRSGITTKIVVLALAAYAVTSLLSLRAKIGEAQVEQKAVKQQVSEKEVENAEIEYKLGIAEAAEQALEQQTAELEDEDAELEYQNALAQYNEVIADIARKNFGLVMPGEIVYYSGDAP